MISDYYLNNWMMSSGNVLCICGITGIQRPKGPPSPTKLRCSPYSHDFKPHIVNIWNTAHMIQNQHWEKRKSLWVLQTLHDFICSFIIFTLCNVCYSLQSSCYGCRFECKRSPNLGVGAMGVSMGSNMDANLIEHWTQNWTVSRPLSTQM